MKTTLLVFLLVSFTTLTAQDYIVKDIKSFGAKGDGKTNDHDAFNKAAEFFNKRGGNGKLIISKGTYLVGKQIFNKGDNSKRVYQGFDVLSFVNCTKLTIEGRANTVIKFKDSLRYGSFDPATGKAVKTSGYFVEFAYAAIVGTMVFISNCSDVTIINLHLNGNSNALIMGGSFGDTGIQIPNLGFHIMASKNVAVSGCSANYFGLDGMMVGNDQKLKTTSDKVLIANCVFEYNSRQGLSWVGGSNLKVTNSRFNHTGRGKFQSAPAAGLDIEAETGAIINGVFSNCEFINNVGCGMVADTGPSSNCTFTNCLFWGTTAWSMWVTKPSFTFKDSKFYGSIAHGYNAETDKDATKFVSCHFEDKLYNGKEPYGNFLIETNYIKRLRFENCTMLAHRKRIVWMESNPAWLPEEKYQLVNCRLVYDGDNLAANEWIALTRNVRIKNSSFEITHLNAKKKGYWFNGIRESYNVNLGGNKQVVGKEIVPL